MLTGIAWRVVDDGVRVEGRACLTCFKIEIVVGLAVAAHVGPAPIAGFTRNVKGAIANRATG